MNHHLPLFATALLALLPGSVGLGEEVRPAEKGTFLGLLFGPLSNTESAAYLRAEMRAVVPSSSTSPAKLAPKNTGVIITHVLPGSPAAKAGLRRNDVVLSYDKVKVRDCEQLARLIRDDKPDRKVNLHVLRDKREQTFAATLALGPALKIATAPRAALLTNFDSEVSKGTIRPTGTLGNGVTTGSGTSIAPNSRASVNLVATPLDNGKMKLLIEFYADGRLQQTVTCQGRADDVANTVQKLPERERNLVRVALQRLRTINQPMAPPATPPRAMKR